MLSGQTLQGHLEEETVAHIDDFARMGLRTLLVALKRLERKTFEVQLEALNARELAEAT